MGKENRISLHVMEWLLINYINYVISLFIFCFHLLFTETSTLKNKLIMSNQMLYVLNIFQVIPFC